MFTVSAEAIKNTSEEAHASVAAMINQAIESLKDRQDVADDDLETGWISISPY